VESIVRAVGELEYTIAVCGIAFFCVGLALLSALLRIAGSLADIARQLRLNAARQTEQEINT
jgi:hypothetical protein